MRLRGFKKGLVYGSLAMLALQVIVRWNDYTHAREIPELTPTAIAGTVLLILATGLACGLLAALMRRVGRPKD